MKTNTFLEVILGSYIGSVGGIPTVLHKFEDNIILLTNKDSCEFLIFITRTKVVKDRKTYVRDNALLIHGDSGAHTDKMNKAGYYKIYESSKNIFWKMECQLNDVVKNISCIKEVIPRDAPHRLLTPMDLNLSNIQEVESLKRGWKEYVCEYSNSVVFYFEGNIYRLDSGKHITRVKECREVEYS